MACNNGRCLLLGWKRWREKAHAVAMPQGNPRDVLHLAHALAVLGNRKGVYPGKPLATSYPAIGAELGIRKNRVRAVLQKAADCGLITFDASSAGTLITTLKPEQSPLILAERPDHGRELAAVLQNRPIPWGTSEVMPSWAVGKLGQVLSSGPNVQGKPKAERTAMLQEGIGSDWRLIQADLKSAEPSCIIEALDRRGLFDPSAWPDDPHAALASVLGLERNTVKRQYLNPLPYRKLRCVTVAKKWGLSKGSIFMRYAKAIDCLRDVLWHEGSPADGLRRNVRTLAGDLLQADRFEPRQIHKGTVLRWLAGGTVANVVNTTCKRILDQESDGRIRLLFPVHDAILLSVKGKVDLSKLFASPIDRLRWEFSGSGSHEPTCSCPPSPGNRKVPN